MPTPDEELADLEFGEYGRALPPGSGLILWGAVAACLLIAFVLGAWIF